MCSGLGGLTVARQLKGNQQPTTNINMSNCDPNQIISALYEEAEIVTDVVRERIKESDRYALRLIPDGGIVRRHSNQDSVIYGEARQAPVQYQDLDHDVRPLVEGEMPGRDQHGQNGIFETDINDIDANACHGQVTIDFSQGYRIRRTIDKGLSFDTPIKCARELDRLGEAHIRGYFQGFYNQFTRYGIDNYAENLLNLTIQYSEANASVLGADQFNVSSGGWQAPPLYRISIHFLQDYRDHIVAELRGRGFEVAEDWMLEVEMPMNDWLDAVKADQVARNPSGTSYNSEVFKDDEGAMRGRRFATYGGIKCYFNERPIRGYFKQVGTSGGNAAYRFVRVYDWINSRDEEGGLVTGVNHQYRQDSIIIDGIKYDMVTLIPHIDPRSFKRYGLIKPLKPYGGDNAGVNYEVKVIDGPYLKCNDFQDKFKLAARHEFRFKAMYPEFSGFIAYRHGRREGYVIEVNPRNYVAGPNNPAGPEQFRIPAPDSCQTETCAQCDQVADSNGDCVESAPAAVLTLSPAGAVESPHFGTPYSIRLAVHRSVSAAGAVTVAYATADGTAEDEAGAGDYTDTNGTLSWAAGDTSPKYIDIPITGDAADVDGKNFTLTISTPVGATIATGANIATITLQDFS
jgi:hypothetical protein